MAKNNQSKIVKGITNRNDYKSRGDLFLNPLKKQNNKIINLKYFLLYFIIFLKFLQKKKKKKN